MPVATVGHNVRLSNGGQQPRYIVLDTRIILPIVLCLLFILILPIIHFLVGRVLHRHILRLAATNILPIHAPACAERPKGLTSSAIAALPTFAYSEEGPVVAECSVCLSFMEKGEVVRLLPGCKHVFHVDCIDMWLHSHPTCPLCRFDVETPQMKAVLPATTPPEVDSLNI